jgi:hypothetical protein
VAAQAAQGAGTSAAAAADSKQDAASYANAAETASTASSAAKVSAEAARDGAANAAGGVRLGRHGNAKANEAGQSAIAANNAATTATTRAADAGVYAAQAASSQANADGSAQAAASFLQQAQAILLDPVTGLVDKYAAVKVLADATAESMGQRRRNMASRWMWMAFPGGFELTAAAAASTSACAPAPLHRAGRQRHSDCRAVYRAHHGDGDRRRHHPHRRVCRRCVHPERPITNAKIGGDIWSSNYAAGQAGWCLSRAGNMEVNNLTSAVR